MTDLKRGEWLFIDTGAFYAKYVGNDDCHHAAMQLWERMGKARPRCVTTNFVVSELITMLVYRFGTKNALVAAREIYASDFIKIIPVNREWEIKALEWLEKFSDQNFSMVDAASFACMKAHNISWAFTFDRHFTVAGFYPLQA